MLATGNVAPLKGYIPKLLSHHHLQNFQLDNTPEIWRMVTVNGKWATGLISQKISTWS